MFAKIRQSEAGKSANFFPSLKNMAQGMWLWVPCNRWKISFCHLPFFCLVTFSPSYPIPMPWSNLSQSINPFHFSIASKPHEFRETNINQLEQISLDQFSPMIKLVMWHVNPLRRWWSINGEKKFKSMEIHSKLWKYRLPYRLIVQNKIYIEYLKYHKVWYTSLLM